MLDDGFSSDNVVRISLFLNICVNIHSKKGCRMYKLIWDILYFIFNSWKVKLSELLIEFRDIFSKLKINSDAADSSPEVMYVDLATVMLSQMRKDIDNSDRSMMTTRDKMSIPGFLVNTNAN